MFHHDLESARRFRVISNFGGGQSDISHQAGRGSAPELRLVEMDQSLQILLLPRLGRAPVVVACAQNLPQTFLLQFAALQLSGSEFRRLENGRRGSSGRIYAVQIRWQRLAALLCTLLSSREIGTSLRTVFQQEGISIEF